MNFYEGKGGHGFDISFSKIIRYATAICLIVFGLFLVAWFVMIALIAYATIISTNTMWLLFLIVPITALFLLAKYVLEYEERVDTDTAEIAPDPSPTSDNTPKTGGN